ncbi:MULTISPECIES: hypothetical protein [unclassified Streptomyces]|uniref:hypothetical protein n=1 Tax=unclassified Streptomyces TaxID=2593676 RepID=UPI0036E70B11
MFIEKVYDVVGLHSVDGKPQIQALGRSPPVLPIMPGMPEQRTHATTSATLLSVIGAQDSIPRAHELGRPQA